MKQVGLKTVALGLLSVLGAAASAAPSGKRLTLNGAVVSSNVQIINGQAYVSLADLARAMGTVIIKTTGGYVIQKAGGASQVQGMEGKVGDMLFDGRWRFKVLSVSMPASYTMKTQAEPGAAYNLDVASWNMSSRTYTPKAGYKLVLFDCMVKNGVTAQRTLWVAQRDTNTALADAEGKSYPPLAYDFEGGPIQSKPLLQGATLQFGLLFSVPEATQLKDLVFSLRNNQGDEKPNDLRISLPQQAAPPATSPATATAPN